MVRNAWTWMVGTRYLRSTHRRGFVSFVAFMSTAGLMLGVAVLIVVLSVMNGFERELRSRILSVTSHPRSSGSKERCLIGKRSALSRSKVRGCSTRCLTSRRRR